MLKIVIRYSMLAFVMNIIKHAALTNPSTNTCRHSEENFLEQTNHNKGIYDDNITSYIIDINDDLCFLQNDENNKSAIKDFGNSAIMVDNANDKVFRDLLPFDKKNKNYSNTSEDIYVKIFMLSGPNKFESGYDTAHNMKEIDIAHVFKNNKKITPNKNYFEDKFRRNENLQPIANEIKKLKFVFYDKLPIKDPKGISKFLRNRNNLYKAPGKEYYNTNEHANNKQRVSESDSLNTSENSNSTNQTVINHSNTESTSSKNITGFETSYYNKFSNCNNKKSNETLSVIETRIKNYLDGTLRGDNIIESTKTGGNKYTNIKTNDDGLTSTKHGDDPKYLNSKEYKKYQKNSYYSESISEKKLEAEITKILNAEFEKVTENLFNLLQKEVQEITKIYDENIKKAKCNIYLIFDDTERPFERYLDNILNNWGNELVHNLSSVTNNINIDEVLIQKFLKSKKDIIAYFHNNISNYDDVIDIITKEATNLCQKTIAQVFDIEDEKSLLTKIYLVDVNNQIDDLKSNRENLFDNLFDLIIVLKNEFINLYNKSSAKIYNEEEINKILIEQMENLQISLRILFSEEFENKTAQLKRINEEINNQIANSLFDLCDCLYKKINNILNASKNNQINDITKFIEKNQEIILRQTITRLHANAENNN